MSDWSGRLQAWLHGGYPPGNDPFPYAWWFGNRVSDLRYWWWRLWGGE